MSSGKRLLDVIAAIIALTIFAPVLVVAAILIRKEDGGEALFRQVRVGRHAQSFVIFKLRTMHNGEHVTKIGRWLRQSGIDEVPQFINVLRGDMSVVGPRPLTEEDLQRLGWAADEQRQAVRPGITGVAQIFGGQTADQSSELDRLYVTHMGVRTDIELILISFMMNMAGKTNVRRWLTMHRFAKEARSNVNGSIG
ncbi:MAG: sugar transferase [Pseudomonadota bacterium]